MQYAGGMVIATRAASAQGSYDLNNSVSDSSLNEGKIPSDVCELMAHGGS